MVIMSTYTAEVRTYQTACDLIQSLKDEGIESNITPGGVNIRCSPDQINMVKDICKSNGASFNAGYSSVEMSVFVADPELLDRAIEVTNDARSVIKEWS